MKEWQRSGDLISQFVHDIEEGEASKHTTLAIDKEGRVERNKLWEHFTEWLDKTNPKMKAGGPGRNKFYKDIALKGFRVQASHGARFFLGISESVSSTSRF